MSPSPPAHSALSPSPLPLPMNDIWQPFIQLPRPEPRREVGAAQSQWLLACLERNAGCAYGLEQGFGRIKSVEDYRSRCPLSDETSLAPWIERMASGQGDCLFAGRPLAFERTSASSGAAKLVAYSPQSLADFSYVLRSWLGTVARRYCRPGPAGPAGRAYWAMSPALALPQRTPGGAPIGLSDAAYIGAELRAAFAAVCAAPPHVGAIADLQEWQLQTWLSLLQSPDLALISIWSPTFLISLLDALPAHEHSLKRALIAAGDDAAITRLARFLASGDGRELWPQLRLVSCWAEGASREFCAQLRAILPHAAFQPKGLIATEGVVTAPDSCDRQVLAAQSGFFEFIGEDGRISLASELTEGAAYEVVMTTSGGLYRYRLGDMVRCSGWAAGDADQAPQDTENDKASEANQESKKEKVNKEDKDGKGWPTLQFIGRSGLVSDLVGEKLTDAFAGDCIAQCFARFPALHSRFHMLIPQIEPAAHYALIIDQNIGQEQGRTALLEGSLKAALARELDQLLGRNPHYRYARQLGQLHPLIVATVHRPLDAYMGRISGGNTLLGNIKPVALRRELDWMATFAHRGHTP